jgi:hypothetical protein
MKNIATLLAVIAVIIIAWTAWRKRSKLLLIKKITEKIGDVPNIAMKTEDELSEMWKSLNSTE